MTNGTSPSTGAAADESRRVDVCVVGAGLVGLATATALADRFTGISIAVLDKEDTVAAHQSGHNSGVVHSGLYYKPGSLKARLCVEGREAVYETCDSAGIPYRRSGKLVIATHETQLPALEELERRGRANGLSGLRRISSSEISDYEPAATGLAALHVPEAGVADYPALAAHLAERLIRRGASIRTGAAVTSVTEGSAGVSVTTSRGSLSARLVVNCAGLQSDVIARMTGADPSVRIVPFRGEYYSLSDTAAPLVRALIYPVPDPRFPFLGVHFTRRIDDTVEVGPNAVLALGREHYRGARADWREVKSILAHRGFRTLAMRHWRAGAKEMIGSRSKRLYARLARSLVPDLKSDDLLVGGSGVRAQAIDTQGNLVDDFVIERVGATVHVLNAPSPGATASIAIGRHIAGQVEPLLTR